MKVALVKCWNRPGRFRRPSEVEYGMFVVESDADVERLKDRMFDEFEETKTAVDASGWSDSKPELVRVVDGRDRRRRLLWQVAVYEPIRLWPAPGEAGQA